VHTKRKIVAILMSELKKKVNNDSRIICSEQIKRRGWGAYVGSIQLEGQARNLPICRSKAFHLDH